MGSGPHLGRDFSESFSGRRKMEGLLVASPLGWTRDERRATRLLLVLGGRKLRVLECLGSGENKREIRWFAVRQNDVTRRAGGFSFSKSNTEAVGTPGGDPPAPIYKNDRQQLKIKRLY